MVNPRILARILTEDPDVYNNQVVIAVHPNYVIDAVIQASSSQDYGPQRMDMLKNYVKRFKRFMDGQIAGGSTVIITTIGNPWHLDTWYDHKNHYEEEKEVDLVKMGMEQEEVYGIHQDLMDYIYEKGALSNVHVVSERLAGDACRTGKLDHLLHDAQEINVIGGNLTGCLSRTVKMLKQRAEGPSVNIINELTFDDDEEFWKRVSPKQYYVSDYFSMY